MNFVSALICTRNRPLDITRAVRSLLRAPTVPHEVIVMDQSDGNDSETALLALGAGARLRYVRSRKKGKGAALNEGLALARGEIVLCTDDDCEAPPEWGSGLAQALESQPTAAIAFSNVTAPPYDTNAGYIPVYSRSEGRLLRWVTELCSGYGLGAGMALRKQVVLSFGGCDEALGPGARFPAAEDLDLSVRALLFGWHVYETADVAIVHHGFRTFAEGRAHAHRDWLGLGATCAKPVRGGRLLGAVPSFWAFAMHALLPPLGDLLELKKPRGLTRVTAFARGFARGLRTPVDRATLVFRP